MHKISYKVSGDHVYLECWYCGKPWKLYFNVIKKIGDCKRCGKIITAKDFLQHFRMEQGLPEIRMLRRRLREIENNGFSKTVEEKFEELEIPVTVPLLGNEQRFPFVWNYLSRRGISKQLIEEYGLRYGVEGRFAGRIVFPIRNLKNEIVGYQGRLVEAFQEGPKYLFSKGFNKAYHLFGIQQARRDFLILVEGVFPAMEFRALATFGKSLSRNQVDVLLEIAEPSSRVVLLWDSDSWKPEGRGGRSSAEKALDLLQQFFLVRAIRLPDVEEGPGQPDYWGPTLLMKEIRRAFRRPAIVYHVVEELE